MTNTFDEEHQRFTFNDDWQVTAWDKTNTYRSGIAKLSGSKAVDFVGLLSGDAQELYWIEVKDFRGYRIPNKQRMSDGDLANEIGQKVRDSIAGFAGACVTRQRSDPWRRIVKALHDARVCVKVVICLEEDAIPGPIGRQLTRRGVLANTIKKRLAWLTARVAIVDRSQNNYPPGLTVIDLPGAGGI